jgi:hypothetical protein
MRESEREGERKGERGRGGGGERCDFLTPLHDKSSTGQVFTLAHFYVGGQGLLTQYGPSSKKTKGKGVN